MCIGKLRGVSELALDFRRQVPSIGILDPQDLGYNLDWEVKTLIDVVYLVSLLRTCHLEIVIENLASLTRVLHPNQERFPKAWLVAEGQQDYLDL